MRPVRANGSLRSSTFTPVSSVPTTCDPNSSFFAVTFAPHGGAQIDAAQQSAQFLRRHLNAALGRLSRGNRIRAFFQTLRPERESVAIPVKYLQPVAAAACE